MPIPGYNDADPIAIGGTFKASSLNVLAFCIRSLRTGLQAFNYLRLAEGAPPSPTAGEAIIVAHSTLHRLVASVNGGPFRVLDNSLAPTWTNSNGTTKTAIVSVPITDWPNGWWVEINALVEVKNSKGSSGSATWEYGFGGQAHALTATGTLPNDAGQWTQFYRFKAVRHGTDLYVGEDNTGNLSSDADRQHFNASQTLSMNAKKFATGPTFAGAQTLELRLTLSADHADFWIHPLRAVAMFTPGP